MTDHGGPDPARPGVPLNPERDGTWHWMRATDDTGESAECACLWEQEAWAVVSMDNVFLPHEMAALPLVYLGPCLTPAEVAAQIAEAEARGREAGLREAAGIADAAAQTAERGALDEWGYSDSTKVRERIYARKYEAERLAAAILTRIGAKP